MASVYNELIDTAHFFNLFKIYFSFLELVINILGCSQSSYSMPLIYCLSKPKIMYYMETMIRIQCLKCLS